MKKCIQSYQINQQKVTGFLYLNMSRFSLLNLNNINLLFFLITLGRRRHSTQKYSTFIVEFEYSLALEVNTRTMSSR